MSETPVKMIQFKTVDGRTVIECKPCELDDKITQVCTFPILSLNLCDSAFENAPNRFIDFIVAYLRDIVGKCVYLVTYLPLRRSMEDVDVYRGYVKNCFSISVKDNDFRVTINVHVTEWNLDVSASPIAIFETKEKAEEFANYLRNLKGCVIGVSAREETTVTEDGCKTERYLEPAPEYDGNFLLD